MAKESVESVANDAIYVPSLSTGGNILRAGAEGVLKGRNANLTSPVAVGMVLQVPTKLRPRGFSGCMH